MTQPFTSFAEFRLRYPIRPSDKGALLGSGSYGRVIKVEDQVDTEWVAIKISEFKGNDPKSLKAEVELAQRVPRQTNIARYDACYRFETDTGISDFAIMKYYPDGNLADLLRHEKLNSTQVYELAKGILLGLQHLHHHRIVHRDFKPANILVSRDNTGRLIPKIADFGLSKLVSDDELDSSDFDLSDGRGTPSYKAPEQIEGGRVSFNLDLWAFGVILYEILTGEKPFRSDAGVTSEQLVRRSIEKKIMTVELPAALDNVPAPYSTIIRRCLVRDIHKRARKESELLDLLDKIPGTMAEAQRLLSLQQYQQAATLFEQILTKRENHPEARQGLNQCHQALVQQQITDLLKQAGVLVAQQQFAPAQEKYEAVLRIKPQHPAAVKGLNLCISQLIPAPIVSRNDEATDLYQEERTDLYEPPLRDAVSPAPKPAPTRRPVLTQSVLPTRLAVPPVVNRLLRRAYPWRVIVPVALGLGSFVFFYNHEKGNSEEGKTRATIVHLEGKRKENVQRAAIGESSNMTVDPTTEHTSSSEKDNLTGRVNEALRKARILFQQKNYEAVIELTNSALMLVPERTDVAALRKAALDAQRADVSTTTGSASLPPADKESVKESSKVAVETSPSSSAEDEKKKLLGLKQEEYEKLLDEGEAAIDNGNNKAKAIARFTEARSLAREYSLNTQAVNAPYYKYMGKANKIFESENFDQAIKWYEVAQALNDGPEVQAKIKKCKANLD